MSYVGRVVVLLGVVCSVVVGIIVVVNISIIGRVLLGLWLFIKGLLCEICVVVLVDVG